MVRGAVLTVLGAGALPSQQPLTAPPIHFVRSEVEASLPQSSVYGILQDHQGFLWFGTREGLGRWDGYEMRTWRMEPFSDQALPDNIVRRLIQDRQGHIYAVTMPDDVQEPHVARLVAPAYLTVESFPERGAVPFLDRDGVAWLAGRDSVYPVDGPTDQRHAAFRRQQPGIAALDALVDRHGRFWVSTLSGQLERFDPRDGTEALVAGALVMPLENRFGRLLEDASGTIWITGRGLSRLVPGATSIERVATRSTVLDTVGTSDIVQDPDGWLWLGTLDGVYRFDPALTTVERHSMRLAGGIATQNYVTALLRDRAGAIWAGTVWGLHRHDPAAKPFTFLTHDPHAANTIGSGLVVSLLEDDSDALWVGTLGGGVNRVDPRTGRVERFQSALGSWSDSRDDWIWSIADAGDGRVWLGTARGLATPRPAPPTGDAPRPPSDLAPVVRAGDERVRHAGRR